MSSLPKVALSLSISPRPLIIFPRRDKMMRDRYKKWGINDKNKNQRRLATAPKSLSTQQSLEQSPRIIEVEDDESHIARNPVDPQNEANLLHPASLRIRSPHAALTGLDPRFHEVLSGLSHWCDGQVNFPFAKDEDGTRGLRKFLETMGEFEYLRTESKQVWRRFVDACSVEMMLLTLRHPRNLFMLSPLFFAIQSASRRQNQHAYNRNRNRTRILRIFCQRAVEVLGSRHPITFLCVLLASGLPLTAMVDIVEGIFRIHVRRETIIQRRRFGARSSMLPLSLMRDRYRLSILLDIAKERYHE